MYAASLASILITISVLAAAGSPRIPNDHGSKARGDLSYAHREDIKQSADDNMVSDDPGTCRKIGEKKWDCTEEIIYDKAKKVKKWYARNNTDRRRSFEAVTTAYVSFPQFTDNQPCKAADGSDICILETNGEHTCAANFLRFGTRLRIGDFICTVRDRIARKYGSRVDIYYGFDLEGAREYGKQRQIITILDIPTILKKYYERPHLH